MCVCVCVLQVVESCDEFKSVNAQGGVCMCARACVCVSVRVRVREWALHACMCARARMRACICVYSHTTFITHARAHAHLQHAFSILFYFRGKNITIHMITYIHTHNYNPPSLTTPCVCLPSPTSHPVLASCVAVINSLRSSHGIQSLRLTSLLRLASAAQVYKDTHTHTHTTI